MQVLKIMLRVNYASQRQTTRKRESERDISTLLLTKAESESFQEVCTVILTDRMTAHRFQKTN